MCGSGSAQGDKEKDMQAERCRQPSDRLKREVIRVWNHLHICLLILELLIVCPVVMVIPSLEF